MLLDNIYSSTTEFTNNMPKIKRKSIGQFFTALPTALYMGNLAEANQEVVRILDAGAGTGVLAASVLQKLLLKDIVKQINIDLYENNDEVIPTLQSNMRLMEINAAESGKKILINHVKENFILYNKANWDNSVKDGSYDIIISNPPYKKIGKKDSESSMMSKVVFGQPNMYFLFMAMAVKLLKDNGEFIFIVPRSWVSGLYFTAFRNYFFENMSVINLHLFESRDRVFEGENVLQETMIIRAKKNQKAPKEITITTSNGNYDFSNIKTFSVPYEVCVKADKHMFMFLPTSLDDVNMLKTVDAFSETLETLGLKLKTGVTVDFRSKQWMRYYPAENTVPLLWAFHFNGGCVKFPLNDEQNQYITLENSALLMDNCNYLLIKRFTSKEERRRLQPAIFLRKEFNEYKYISTENHLNFITRVNGELTEDEAYGLYVVFGSTLWDKYYRILNGNTQVNATEINAIPIPCISDILYLGSQARQYSLLTTQICDYILEELIHEKGRSKENTGSIRYACETTG